MVSLVGLGYCDSGPQACLHSGVEAISAALRAELQGSYAIELAVFRVTAP